MTPNERKKFDVEIYEETKEKKNRGCITDAADYLRHRNSDRVSRLINPNDERANTIFGEVVDLLEAFNHKHPLLAQFIWKKICLKVNGFMETGNQTVKLAEFAQMADAAAREQMDVNSAVMLGQSVEDIQKEAFEALQKSQAQYDKAMKLGASETQIIEREQ